MTASSSTKTREVATFHESKTYRAQLEGKTLTFDKHRILGDGNCGFTSLGTTREEVSSLLLSLAADEKSRIELSDEIQGLLRENRGSKLHTEETQKLFAELDAAQTEVDEQVRQLNNQLASEAKSTSAAIFQRLNLEDLIERLKNSSYSTHQTALTSLRSARLQIFQSGEKINICCQSREVFEHYITEGLARIEWLGYRSAKLFAKLKDYNLYVFRPSTTQIHWLELAEQQICAFPKNTFYLLYTDGFTHYNLLSVAPIPVSDPTLDSNNTSIAQKSSLPVELKMNTGAPVSVSAEMKKHETFKTVPALKIDFEILQKTVQRIAHQSTQAILNKMLAIVQKRVTAFEEDRADPIFSSIAHQHALNSLLYLEGILATDWEKIKEADTISKRRAEGIFIYLKNAIDKVKKEIIPAVAPDTVQPEPLWQKHRLRFGQQLLLSGSLYIKFKEALEKVAKSGRDHHLPKSVFICYAWPRLESEQEKHLAWVQPFLKGLRQHLHQAGLTTVKLDIEDGLPGGNIETYMKGAATADFVLLIGTESLLFKHEGSGASAVCTELVHIRRSRDTDSKTGKHRVFPLLISGNYPEAFPAEYDRYNTVKDWKAGPQTYFEHLCWLIPALYRTDKEAFEVIWAEFLQALTEDERVLVTQGLMPDQVLSQLAAEQQQKKAEDQKYESVSRYMLGLDSSGAMKEVKRLLPAFESKQTHTSTLTDSWDLPPRNDHYFTGRVIELKKLNETSKGYSVISGLGGVGKTQLAIYHLYHPEHSYALRIWFQAETDTILHKEYLEFAQAYKLPLEEKAPKREVIKAVKHYLAKQPSWLAVYDNAGSYSEIKDFLLDELDNGHRIITTRRTEWHDIGHKLEIYIFSETEAIVYLKKVIQRDDKQTEEEEKALAELARELGYLPLALAQAGAYIKSTGVLIAEYLQLYCTSAIEMLKDTTLPIDSNVQPVAIIWDISLKAIEAEEQKAGDTQLSLSVLQAMSYLAPDHIPRSLLERWLAKSIHIKKDQSAKLLLNKALRYLSAYSIIKVYPEQKTLSVHRLVQEMVRSRLQLVKSTIPSVPSLKSKDDASSTTSFEQSPQTFLLADLVDSSLEEFNQIHVLGDEKQRKALLLHLQALIKHLEQALSLEQHAKELLVRLNQLHGLLARVYLCYHAELKQAGKSLAEQQLVQTMAKKHFEEGIKGLVASKTTDASFLLQQEACYNSMMAQAVKGNWMEVRQVLESYTQTLAASPAEAGVGDAKALMSEKKGDQKQIPRGSTEKFPSAQFSDNPHRFSASISSAHEVRAVSSRISQEASEGSTAETLEQLG